MSRAHNITQFLALTNVSTVTSIRWRVEKGWTRIFFTPYTTTSPPSRVRVTRVFSKTLRPAQHARTYVCVRVRSFPPFLLEISKPASIAPRQMKQAHNDPISQTMVRWVRLRFQEFEDIMAEEKKKKKKSQSSISRDTVSREIVGRMRRSSS